MLIAQNVAYTHPDQVSLFSNLNLTVNRSDKIALIGNNGSGKSTFLKILSGAITPSAGQVAVPEDTYYIPQVFGQFNEFSIARALQVAEKLEALHQILQGDVSDHNMERLNDDWAIEERCYEALNYWGLPPLDLWAKMETLSGGQKMKVFLAGILIHTPDLILLDEPGNHLDTEGLQQLAHFIKETDRTLILVSHDRTLLNLLHTVAELSRNGISLYGGNYDFYLEQKQLENNALEQTVQSEQKALRKAKEKERETIERQQRRDARGKGKQEKSGVARIMMNTLRNQAERSTAQLNSVHAAKITALSESLQALRAAIPDVSKMKLGFDATEVHSGKMLFKAVDINFHYGNRPLWQLPLNLEITSGTRMALKGQNGSGKTTLLNIILGSLEPSCGKTQCMYKGAVYVDQQYSLLNEALTIYEQVQQFNTGYLQEHEVKIRLTWFLFNAPDWNKPCSMLSGGERMRLTLCCLTVGRRAPEIMILDEPTNNLDIINTEILTAALNQYRGTLIVVSHDEYFLTQININRILELSHNPERPQ